MKAAPNGLGSTARRPECAQAPASATKFVTAAADYLNRKTDKDMRRNKLVRICRNLASLAAGHNG